MKTNRILALLLAAVMLLSIVTGCNTVTPDGTEPSGSVGTGEHVGSDETGTTHGIPGTTTGTENNTGDEDPTGTTGSHPAGDETISGTETTEPSTNPTTEPSTPTTNPTDPSDENNACAHKYSNWTTKAATCTANGSKTRTCVNCGKVETESIPATGHSFGSWSTTKKATCDTNGVKTRKCSKCSKEETETIAATGHNWDSGKVTTTPTSCSDMGIKTYTCKTCGKTKTEQIKGNHTFGEWKWEEYTFNNDGYNQVSHRKYRTCTKCGYKETDGTAAHYCAKGSVNHTVTTVKAGTCTTKATMRSTCKICGWYVEYEGKKGSHTIVDKEVHLSDYGAYTNELDATVSECTSCGTKSIVYHKGEGWSDYNRYRVNFSVNSGNAYMAQPETDNFKAYEHPTWQTVRRDFVYDSEGYVKQFTLYWWYNGSRYSQVIKCGKGEIEAWFADAGLTATTANSCYIFRVYATEVRPYQIGYSG